MTLRWPAPYLKIVDHTREEVFAVVVLVCMAKSFFFAETNAIIVGMVITITPIPAYLHPFWIVAAAVCNAEALAYIKQPRFDSSWFFSSHTAILQSLGTFKTTSSAT